MRVTKIGSDWLWEKKNDSQYATYGKGKVVLMMWEWMDRMLPQNPVTISFSPLDSQPQTSRTLLFSSLSIELAQWDLPKTDHDWLVIVELPQISSQRFSLFFHNFANFETNIRSFDHKYRGILYHKSVITVTIPFELSEQFPKNYGYSKTQSLPIFCSKPHDYFFYKIYLRLL